MPERPSAGLKITALTLNDAATVLGRASGRSVTIDVLRAHVKSGAPINPDGTLNLITYAAWLVKSLKESSHD